MKSAKKVLIITYYWPPSGGAGVQRTLKFVKYLPEFGIEPIVLTVDGDIASYPVKDESLASEVPQGLRVIKTKSFEPLNILAKVGGQGKVPYGGFSNTNNRSITQTVLRWVRGNLFIPDARKGWVKYAVEAAEKLIREDKIDTIYISSPPHSSQLIGLKLRKKFPSLRWVADLRDPWTSIYYYDELMHTSIAKWKDLQYEKKVLRECNHAMVVSKQIRETFVKETGIENTKISVIPNGYDDVDFRKDVRQPVDRFTINYTGTLAETYNPSSVLKAIAEFSKEKGQENIRFRFVGTLPPAIRNMLTEYGLDTCCEFIPYVPHHEATGYMQASHINLLMIPDSKGAEGILTGKLFEYLGSGQLILGVGPVKGEAASIVNDCQAGRFFERNEETALKNWLGELYEVWKSGRVVNNSSQVHQKYHRRALTAGLAEILKK